MKLAILLMLLMLAVPCMAQNVNFAWDSHPQAAELDGFALFQRANADVYDMLAPVAIFPGGSTTTGSAANPTHVGKYCWVLTARVTISGEMFESDPSNEVCKKILPVKPGGFREAIISAAAPFKGIGSAVASLFTGHQNLKLAK